MVLLSEQLAFIQQRLDRPLSIVLDIDETLLNPIPRWSDLLSRELGIAVSVDDLERAGGTDGYFIGGPHEANYRLIMDRLRSDESNNAGLLPIEGALDNLKKLLDHPQIRLACYLSTRPVRILEQTIADLRMRDYPDAPVVLRPSTVDYAHTAAWKLSVLEEIAILAAGTTAMIDDSIGLAQTIHRRNREQTSAIVIALFTGPITWAKVSAMVLLMIRKTTSM